MYLPIIALFIALSGSVGVSYVTENSQPGDTLYPLKVHIDNSLHIGSARSNAMDTPTEADSKITSSSSLYLHPSSYDNTADNNQTASASIDVSASTSLDASQVINAK